MDCLIHRFSSLLTRALPLVIFVILINVTLFFHSYKFIQILNRWFHKLPKYNNIYGYVWCFYFLLWMSKILTNYTLYNMHVINNEWINCQISCHIVEYCILVYIVHVWPLLFSIYRLTVFKVMLHILFFVLKKVDFYINIVINIYLQYQVKC